MRSLKRQRQYIWFVSVTEENDGIDRIRKYSRPIKRSVTVSATSGTPEEISAGIVPSYDRYITSFDREYSPVEGDMVYVDRIPDIDDNGRLSMAEDGVTPTVQPDYVLVKILDTQRGNLSRYGIKRVDTANG